MSGAKQGLFDPEELRRVNIAFVDPFWFDSSNSFARGKHQDSMSFDPTAYTTPYTSTPNPAAQFTFTNTLEYGKLTPEINQPMSRSYTTAYTTPYTSTPNPAVQFTFTNTLEYGKLTPEINQPMSHNSYKERLSTEQVIEIYAHLPRKATNTARLLAVKYGVTSKAIRDIWTGRTWSATVGIAKNKKYSHK